MGDSQGSRRRGYGAARPRQGMTEFRGSFAENINAGGPAFLQSRMGVCAVPPPPRANASAVHPAWVPQWVLELPGLS